MLKTVRSVAIDNPWCLRLAMVAIAVTFVITMGWWGFDRPDKNGEAVADVGALLATRRPRSPGEAQIWAAHLAVVEGGLGADRLAGAGYTVMTFNYPYTERGSKRPDRTERLVEVHHAAADLFERFAHRRILSPSE